MSSALNRMMKTEGFRLSAIYAVAFAISVLTMGGAVLRSADNVLRGQVVQYSQADIAAIADGYRMEGVPEAREVINQIMAAPGGSDVFLLQHDGKRLAGNADPMPTKVGVVTLPGRGPGHDVLGVGQFIAPGIYAFSGSDLDHVHTAQASLLRTLLWLFGAGLVVAVVGGAVVSRSFLHRTDAMAKACRAIMDGDMRARIPVRGSGDELDRLAEAINAMLDRIAGLMENLGQVTNDIAHDLRTPVTHLRTGLERAGASENPDEIRGALHSAIARCDEILALFTALLRIAQIEGGARRSNFTIIDLPPLMHQMRDMLGAVAEEEKHHLIFAVQQGIVVRGDRELLVQLLANLIENAIMHTPAGTTIEVCLGLSDGRPFVRVSDDGPGVPREEHARLFQRLYRREASRARPGYGLGLSIALAIADLHGAKLRIVDRQCSGLCIELMFPAPSGHTIS